MPDPIRKGLLIIISSPSGAGKSTLAKRLLADDAAISFSVSATTRPMRPGEVEGKDYYFKTPDDFARMVAKGEMLEHAEVFGNSYGSPLAPVAQAVSDGRDVLFDVDWQGGQQIRASGLRDTVVSIFLLPPSIAELEKRLNARGQDSATVVAGRMAKSRDEISHWAEYDYVLVNENLDVCETQLRAIVAAERLRRDRQPGLMARVRNLNAEFEENL
jgi:guanylate kinase